MDLILSRSRQTALQPSTAAAWIASSSAYQRLAILSGILGKIAAEDQGANRPEVTP